LKSATRCCQTKRQIQQNASALRLHYLHESLNSASMRTSANDLRVTMAT